MATIGDRAAVPIEPGGEGEPGCAFVLDAADPGAGARFCNAPQRPGSAYCPLHHASCYLRSGSVAERRQLREIEALAEAVGGKRGPAGRRPPRSLLRRLDRIARAFSSPQRSRNVREEAGRDATIR